MIIELKRSYRSLLGNPVINNVDSDIFTTPAIPMPTDGGKCETCNYGVDIDIKNMRALMPHTEALKKLLGIPKNKPHFYIKLINDLTAPGGKTSRVTIHDGQCTFAARDGNGPKCGVERYALTNEFSVLQLKPQVCTMYPVTYAVGEWEGNCLVVSDDTPAKFGTQSVYQAARENLRQLFGNDLLKELDALASQFPFTPKQAPVTRSAPAIRAG